MTGIILGLLLLTVFLTVSHVSLSPLIRWGLSLAAGLVLLAGLQAGDIWSAVLALSLTLSNSRLVSQRYGLKRQRRAVLRSTQLIIGFWLLGHALAFIYALYPQLEATWLRMLISSLLIVMAARALTLVMLRSRIPRERLTKSASLPTVSLCIPARNETHALTDALRAALASDYPKLEILVLDDCSQDSTPDIIRAFAQDGVRFIQAQEPAETWIGKNRAYELLLGEASGDVVLFAGVDIRLQAGSVRQMVNLMLARQAKLVSVLPRRRHFDLLANLIRPLRYYWQLAFAGWPFVESCWLVDRNWLVAKKGFIPIKHRIQPGRILADQARHEGAYAFFVAHGEAAITTRKRIDSLHETAIRTLYPRLRREPISALVKSALLLMIWLLGLAVWQQPDDWAGLIMRFGLLALGFSYIYSELIQQGQLGWLSGLFAPIVVLGEVIATLTSMLRYEFGRVDWKGRNVCLAVMHQRPRARRSTRGFGFRQGRHVNHEA